METDVNKTIMVYRIYDTKTKKYWRTPNWKSEWKSTKDAKCAFKYHTGSLFDNSIDYVIHENAYSLQYTMNIFPVKGK